MLRLFAEKKITRENAFELDLVAVAEHAKLLAKGKNGFAEAGTQLEAMQYLYGKEWTLRRAAQNSCWRRLLALSGALQVRSPTR